MSLSAWEQDALDSIKHGLADSDPELVAQLAMFTRLASGEDMPVREKIQAVKRRVARRRRRMYQRLHETVAAQVMRQQQLQRRGELEAASCECYAIIVRQSRAWRNEAR